MDQKIAFTGGGSIGHVAVNVALIPYFQKQGYQTFYIGSKQGIEKEMIEKLDKTPYYPISSGKLRRYFDWKNFIDPFKVLKGILDAFFLLRKERPQLIFSKGGFVSVPVAVAAKLLNIPVVLHESDVTPGLANKISIKFSDHIFTTFEEAATHLPQQQVTVIGAIIRENLFEGNVQDGLNLTNFNGDKPILLVMGGSLGSATINQVIRSALSDLLEKFQIIHLTGKGLISEADHQKGYVQYEFVTDELNDLLAMSDLVISRAGSNAIFEFLALKIPMLLIPLSSGASRGDQLLNAKHFEKEGYAKVLFEEEFNKESLIHSLTTLYNQRLTYKEQMAHYQTLLTIPEFFDKIIAFKK